MLIPCPECGTQVSELANACPKCGLANPAYSRHWLYWRNKLNTVVVEKLSPGTDCYREKKKCIWVLVDFFNSEVLTPVEYGKIPSSRLECKNCHSSAWVAIKPEDRLPLYKDLDVVEKGSCLVATAVYGTRLAPEIETLKEFRNRFLLRNILGRTIVQVYYSISPAVAAYISESVVRKRIVKTAIVQPIVMIARAYLRKNFVAKTTHESPLN